MSQFVAALIVLTALTASAQLRTMRVDYVHTGSAAGEQFALDRVALEGAWPGPLDRWIDETNLGKYYFQVIDLATNRLLYSRGFASVYGEWETTDEAKEGRRAFSESLRFPAPASPVQVVLKKRSAPRHGFREVWSVVVDPADPAIGRAPPPKLNVWAVVENGPPRDKVDLLLLGDGYTAAQMEKWHSDARRTAGLLFTASPFREHRRDFNVWPSTRRRMRAAFPVPRMAFTASRRSVPPTTRSDRNATSLRSTTAVFVRSAPRRPTSSWKS